jgi:hypothetical protein
MTQCVVSRAAAVLTALAAVAFLMALPAHAHDRDGNPPGWRGGPGTNWENPPGPRGGPGASPDRRRVVVGGVVYDLAPRMGGYYYHVGLGYWHPAHGWWNQAGRCWADRDDNPPGPAGGRGTNWENPPGWRGGPGASPNRYGRCR